MSWAEIVERGFSPRDLDELHPINDPHTLLEALWKQWTLSDTTGDISAFYFNIGILLRDMFPKYGGYFSVTSMEDATDTLLYMHSATMGNPLNYHAFYLYSKGLLTPRWGCLKKKTRFALNI